MSTASTTVPGSFIWRRLHSLTGLWFTLFLIEHLLTNSQAALWLGDNGREFVKIVNGLHNLPYLEVIEIVLLGVPFLYHMILGIKYIYTAKYNSFKTDGSQPSLPRYSRNHAYTWQRYTAWILVFALLGHVVKFRFVEYPESLNEGAHSSYFVKVSVDPGLHSVADRLDVRLYGPHEVQKIIYDSAQNYRQKSEWVRILEKFHLKPGQVIAETKNFGTASLMSVRDTFKSPVYIAIYTIFVLAACYHGFNGLWTFLVTWGAVLKMASQKTAVWVCLVLMLIVIFLGLVSIWGTYWANLKY